MIINDREVALSELKTVNMRKEFFLSDANWYTLTDSPLFFWKFDMMHIEGHGTFFRYSRRHRHPHYSFENGAMEEEVSCHTAEYYFSKHGNDINAIDYTCREGAALEEFKTAYLREREKERSNETE